MEETQPLNLNMSIHLTKGAVFRCIGCKFVQQYRNGLGDAGLQRNTLPVNSSARPLFLEVGGKFLSLLAKSPVAPAHRLLASSPWALASA